MQVNTKDFKTAIDQFITKYNELLAASTYFKKGIFNYYNAALFRDYRKAACQKWLLCREALRGSKCRPKT